MENRPTRDHIPTKEFIEMLKKSSKGSRGHRSSIAYAISNACQNIGHVIGQIFEPFRLILYLLFVSPIKFLGNLFGIGRSENRSRNSAKTDAKNSERYFREAQKIRWQMFLEGEFGQFIKTLLAIITLPFWLPWRLIRILGRPRDNRPNF